MGPFDCSLLTGGGSTAENAEEDSVIDEVSLSSRVETSSVRRDTSGSGALVQTEGIEWSMERDENGPETEATAIEESMRAEAESGDGRAEYDDDFDPEVATSEILFSGEKEPVGDGNEEAGFDASLRVARLVHGTEELVSEGVTSLVAGAERSGSPVTLALQARLVRSPAQTAFARHASIHEHGPLHHARVQHDVAYASSRDC